MACPDSNITGCDFSQLLVDETPRFDELILADIRATDGWLFNVSTGTTPMGTPVEITQDRFRAVFPNTTKQWTRRIANGPGCIGNPCDPTEHQIGWGADRLTYYAEEQHWETPLLCYDQLMHITEAERHLDQIISDILKPATLAISSNFLRKRALLWARQKDVANRNFGVNGTDGVFTFTWTLGGVNGDDEIYFDTSASPSRVFKLTPQMLQARFNPLMLEGYAGKNPFKETSPFIELVTDLDTAWQLDHLGGQTGVGAANNPNVLGNWRFTQFDESTKYWRYGYSGQIGNYMARVDPMGLRFNYVTDLGAGVGANRYRYQVVLPYRNEITTGAGGSAGIGSIPNPDYDKAHYRLSYIFHKKAMELLVPDSGTINPEMPFGHRNFAGKWMFVMDNLGADGNGVAIQNKRRNKGQFIGDFVYYIRPLYTEFMEAIFHVSEQMCIPEIAACSADPGYPAQAYASTNPECPVPAAFAALYGTGGVPSGSQDGNPPDRGAVPTEPDI